MQEESQQTKEKSIMRLKDDKWWEEKQKRWGIQNAGGLGYLSWLSTAMPNQYSNGTAKQIEINIGKKKNKEK